MNMMKVAWCKHCGGAFAYAMHPYPMPVPGIEGSTAPVIFR